VLLTLSILASCLLAGSLVFCVLCVVATARYAAQPVPPEADGEGISILRPLKGIDAGMAENLRSLFRQRYAPYEVLLAVADATDPAVAVVEMIQSEFRHVPSRLLVVGEPPWPNAKVWSLHHLLAAAQYDLVVMSDSDVQVPNEHLLTTIAREFRQPGPMLATCPYRAVGGPGLWSRLEALGMNTEFLAGLFMARMLEGVRFAVGPTLAARRSALPSVGGMEALKDFLAEDFELGRRMAQVGHGVILSRYFVEHRIGNQPLGQNFAHRLRWCRSSRRSRPSGYVGQLFTYPLPLALLCAALMPTLAIPILLGTLGLRYLAARATTSAAGAPLGLSSAILLPLQDLLAFGFWLAGFFGNTIHWRGRSFRLEKDGRFSPAE
jgi:ceramide glucosyltransferase